MILFSLVLQTKLKHKNLIGAKMRLKGDNKNFMILQDGG